MPEGVGLYDPEWENAVWSEYERQQTTNQAQRNSVTPAQARRAAEIARRQPNLPPGAVIGLTFTGADDTQVDIVAAESLKDQANDPLWRTITDRGYSGLKGASRWFLTGVMAPFEEIDRGVRAIAAASDVASRDEGGFFAGELAQEIPRQWSQLPASTLATSINEAIGGRGADIGEGLLPAGRVAEIRTRQAEQVRFGSTGQPVTMGDMFAGVFHEPGSRAYDFTKAVTGTAWEFGADPLLALDRPVRTAMQARKTLGGVSAASAASKDLRMFGLVNGPRRTVLPEVQIDNWLNSETGTTAKRWLTETEDFEAIRARVGSAEAAHHLSLAQTEDEVAEIVRHYAGRQISEKFKAPLSYRVGRKVEDTALASMWDQATDLAGSNRYSRIGKWTPGDAINLEDADQAAEQFSRWFKNWKAPKEMASTYTRQLVGRVLDDDIQGAWDVFRDANRALGDDLVARGHNRDVVRSLTKITGGPDFIDGRDIRAYWVDQVSGQHALHPGARTSALVDGAEEVLPSPHIFAEFMDRGIPLLHNQEIRRATGTLSRLADVPGVGKFVNPAKGATGHFGIWDVHDALWGVQRSIWMPLTLVTRIAWPMRVVGEEQLRMGASGYDSLFRHPLSYVSWALGKKGNVGLADDVLAEAEQFQRSLVSGAPKAYYGDVPSQVGQTNWRRVRTAGASTETNVAAWKIEIGKLASDEAARRTADAIRQGDNSLDSVFAWFNGSQMQQRMASGSDTFREAFATEAGTRDWLQSVAQRVRQMTGDDADLLNVVADGAIDGKNVASDLGARTGGFSKALGSTLANKMDRIPEWLVAPVDVLGGEQRNAAVQMADFITTNLFYGLGAVPSNKLSRSPVFRQMYWRKMSEVAANATPDVQREILRRARKANLEPDNFVRKIVDKVSTADNIIDDIKRNINETSSQTRDVDGLVQTVDEADMLAKEHALHSSHQLLYNLDEKGQAAEALRLIFPFGSAWQEIGKTWLKILGTNPMMLRRGQIVAEGARDAGFFYTDPTSGEEMYAQPGVGLLEDWMLDPSGMFSASGGSENIRSIGASRVEGLNLFAGQVMPGVGPVIQMPTAALLPDKPAFDDLRDIILPFGSTVNEPGDFASPNKVVSGLMPAWMRKAATAVGQEGYDDRMWNSHVVDAARALKATGRYDTSTPEGQKELEDAAKAVAKKTLWARALGQMGLPTGFRVDYQVDAGSTDAEKTLRKVLGEDAMLGKNDGNFFSTAVLSSFWWKLKEDYEGDSYKATRAFLELFGHDPDNYDLQTWVATLGTGKTRALTKRAKTEQGRAWERQNEELVEELPLVVGYFAPEDVATDALDLSAILGDVESGDRIPLDGAQFIRASHKLLGSAIYRNQSEKVEGRNDEESRAWKANWRSWLDENFPYWRFDDPTLPSGAQFEERLSQLERAVQFEAVQETDAGRALTEYLAKRESALTQLQGMEGITTREQAQTALRTRKSTAHLRSWLRQWGTNLRSRNGGFAPVWEEVLSHEVEGTEEEQ